jgi:Ala-tRNA(Pro) deacylase
MPATPETVFAALDKLGIAHSTVSHAPLFTVEQSQALRGQIPGAHTKNLFLKDRKDAMFLVTVMEDAVMDLKTLPERIGSHRLSFGSAERLMTYLGIAPGSVSPLAAINDTNRNVSVILDASLMRHDIINAHPLVNTMTTSLRREDLVAFLASIGHPPQVLRVTSAD